jgi:hypothetical protein
MAIMDDPQLMDSRNYGESMKQAVSLSIAKPQNSYRQLRQAPSGAIGEPVTRMHGFL